MASQWLMCQQSHLGSENLRAHYHLPASGLETLWTNITPFRKSSHERIYASASPFSYAFATIFVNEFSSFNHFRV